MFWCYDHFGQAPKKKVSTSSEKMRPSLICQSEYTLRGHQPITGYRHGGRLAFKKGVAGKRSLRATCNQPSKRGIMSKGSRPEQAVLSRDTDMSKTEETRKVIEGMVDGLNDHRIADIGEFFTDGFRWMGNAGCGTKNNLKEFQDNWQKPFQVAYFEKSDCCRLNF